MKIRKPFLPPLATATTAAATTATAYLEYVVTDIVYLNDRRTSFAQFRTQHVFKSRARRHQNNFMSVKYFSFDSKLHVGKFWIVYEFRIDSRRRSRRRAFNRRHFFPSVTRWKYIGQKKSRSLFLQQQKDCLEFFLFARPSECGAVGSYLRVSEYVEQERKTFVDELRTVIVGPSG